MVYSGSLLSLAAAVVGASLAWFTLNRPRPRSRRQTFFALLNIGSAIWATGRFVLMNYAPGREVSTFAFPDPGYFISVVMAIGVGMTTLFWFLFAAEHAGKRTWTKGPVAWAAVASSVYTVAVTIINPPNGLLAAQSEAFGPLTIGPLFYPYVIGTFTLVCVGMYLLVLGSWTRGTVSGRRQAMALGGVSLFAILGGLGWQLQSFIPIDPMLNPVPLILATLELVLVGEVVTGGLADLLPHARAAAFDAMQDAAIVLDTRMRVATLNRAATQIFPMIEEGMPISDYFSSLGLHARSCIERHPEGVSFEAILGESVYWGRARRLEGQQKGCLILLTDLTDLRLAQNQLMQMGVEPGGKVRQTSTVGSYERDIR